MSLTDPSSELGLSSPSKAVRSDSLSKLKDHDRINEQVLQLLMKIDEVPATITHYRQREVFLEGLLRELKIPDLKDSKFAEECSFQYLLGSLYINFEKFWGPTIRILTELLYQANHRKLLLSRLLDHLEHTNCYIYNRKECLDPELIESRPDFVLHRNFVIQLLSHFTNYVEENHVQFMEQFFLFVDKELRTPPFIDKGVTIDLSSSKQEEKSNHIEKPRSSQHVEEELSNQSASRKETRTAKKRPRVKVKNSRRIVKFKKNPLSEGAIEKRKSRETFVTISKIIQSFSNILRVHRQAELKELILDLLCCRDLSVQRAAFNCLCAYNIEALKPYNDSIRKILDEKKVRSELSVFSINCEESGRVLDDHREQLIPIIQRIVFGRMISNVGKKTSGRDNAARRKDFVMRFISGCRHDEVYDFFKLLFAPIFRYLDTPYSELGLSIIKELNTKEYIPINKLQAMLDTVNSFMKTIGHQREALLPYCFKIINIISLLVIRPMNDENSKTGVSISNMNLLKNVRRSCMNMIAYFYKKFLYYRFSQDETDFVFETIIWPASQDFLGRNYATVTPILSLIETFCSNPVYHNLLIKRNKQNRDEFLLDHLMSLYSSEKVDRSVMRFISNLIADILGPDRDLPEEDRANGENQLDPLLDEDSENPTYNPELYCIADSELPHTHKILMRYVPMIVARLSAICELFVEKKSHVYRFEKSELYIISTLSSYLRESDHCVMAARLLLSTLSNVKSHELIIGTIRTAQSLLKEVKPFDNSSIVCQIADTLYYQYNYEQRNELCNLIGVLSRIDDRLVPIHEIIGSMNRMSEQYVEMPDLVKWNEGFNKAFEYVDNSIGAPNDPNTVLDPLILLVNQIGFIINSVDKYEFSIRDNCLIFFERFADKFKSIDGDEHQEFVDKIIGEVILKKLVKKGLRNTNEMIRHLYLGIIRALAFNCSDKHQTLKELSLLCNQNQDLDFWHNLRHIQLHNRSKALARLLSDESLLKLSPKTMSGFILPLASGFLFNKNYKSLGSLIENSIKIIGIICRHLDWRTYESTLSYYLGLLTKVNTSYQHTNIKLITEVIKNFNFDISACDEAMENKAEDERLEKRMRKRLIRSASQTRNAKLQSTEPKILDKASADVAYQAVMKILLPRLNSCLHEMTRVEFEHDRAMADYMPEKDEIKRIPIAFAIVQLLTILPCKYVLLRDNLPALFLKLATFLKSKNENSRKVARSTLVRIMNFVGPAYIPDLLRILRQNLDKGFHIHVLNYTLCSVLQGITLEYGDLDSSSSEMMDMCMKEIFGKPSEDKEIAQILAKTSEAKKTRSYDTLLILASHITCDSLDTVMSPVKNHLKIANEPRMVNKLSMCIQRIFTGLSQNKQFPLDKLLVFIQSTIEESIPSLRVRKKVDTAQTSSAPIRVDRYLIDKEKVKGKSKSMINERGNTHMLVENSLRLLLQTFEKNRLPFSTEAELQSQLDGFIKLLTTCLKSSSPRCVTRALKCLYFIARTTIDLPAFKKKSNSIVRKIFILLSLYNGVGMARGDNFDMIGMCFKTLNVLFLKCEYLQFDSDQIQALLSYIEQDLNDPTRQATAFRTLYSLVRKKCDSPELPTVLKKVAESLVTSDDDTIRLNCIKIWQIYLLDYQHDGDKLQTYLNGFLRQLDFESIDGRKSVLKMMRAIIEKFPESILRDHFELMFYLLAQKIVNDESKDIRTLVGRLIALLLRRLPEKQMFTLNKFIFPWATNDNMQISILGIKLLSIFVESCPSHIDKDKGQISRVLSVISTSLEREKPRDDQVSEKSNDTKPITTLDRLTYHSLRLFKRLLDKSIIQCVEVKHIELLKKIWLNISQDKLTHRHEPVVLTSCMLYHHFIEKTNLKEALKSDSHLKSDYIERNATRITTTLSDKFIDLLDRFDESSKVHGYIVQCLITIGQMVANSKATLEFESKYISAFGQTDPMEQVLSLDRIPEDGLIKENMPYDYDEAKKRGALIWLCNKIVMQARKEAALFRLSSYHRRHFVLSWTAAIAQELGAHRLTPYIILFLSPSTRELSDKGKEKSDKDTLNVLSLDLLRYLKSLLGLELFNKLYAKVVLHFTKKRVERKKTQAIMNVKQQSRGVKRKLAKRKDKDMKRRKTKAASLKLRALKQYQ